MFCVVRVAQTLTLEERSSRQHTYELQLKKTDTSREDDMIRSYMNEQSTRNAIQLLGVDAVTSSTIALTAARGNRLWATYYGEIILGNVEDESDTFKVLFDTGSSELWVPDELCQSSACLSRKRFAREGRWTAKFDQHGNYVPILVKYLTGEMRAVDGTADVNLMNGITVKNANVGLATNINIPILMELPWDGILGLGFATDDQLSRGSRPLLQSIQDNSLMYPHYRNQFAYYITKTGGNVTFGGYNNDYKRSPEDEFQWVPVSEKGSYWAVNLLEVSVKEPENYVTRRRAHTSKLKNNVLGGAVDSPLGSNNHTEGGIESDIANREGSSSVTKSDAFTTSERAASVRESHDEDTYTVYRNKIDDTKVIIDTGTYLIYAPQVDKRQLHYIRYQTMRNLIASLTVDRCDDMRTLPTLIFTLQGNSREGTVKVQLTPDDYVLKFNDDDGQQICTLGITVDDQQEELQLNAWTFGEVFLRAYYTVFDYDQRQIGFTPSRRDAQ
ncbi:Aspartic proteinase A3 [Babesia sp. Xinjiang]|uniref:Aspartic proteinase A3 n=1 Tax=Babesia sp. Xinjiang TaxID=462227 RepID=UPI000A263D02|nr:Aspartic proteinase A3 [Babesia sp. Xinjiang]ORM39531.1 Aspartic proteinase A3 [Babesia sp. Xinjiang]